MKLKNYAAFAAITLAGVATSQAATVTIANFSFEDQTVADGATNTGAIDGWVSTGGTRGIENHNTGKYAGADASEGNNVFFNNTSSGTVTTAADIGLIAEGTYTLSVDFMVRTGASADRNPLTDFGLVLTSADTTILGTAGTYVNSVQDPTHVGGIFTRTYTLTVGAGNANIGTGYKIHFDAVGSSGNFQQMSFDNVKLDFAPVPEPSSTALLGLGGLALILHRRR